MLGFAGAFFCFWKATKTNVPLFCAKKAFICFQRDSQLHMIVTLDVFQRVAHPEEISLPHPTHTGWLFFNFFANAVMARFCIQDDLFLSLTTAYFSLPESNKSQHPLLHENSLSPTRAIPCLMLHRLIVL